MQYTGKDRVLAAYRREYADRVPIFVGYIGPKLFEKLGFTIVEYLTDPEKAIKAAIAGHEEFPSDIMMVPANPLLPDVQAQLRRLRGDAPVKHRLADNKGDLAKMQIRRPEDDRLVAPHLEMCQRTSAVFKDVIVETLVGGPWSTAMDLRGTEQLIYDTMDDPQFVHELMAYCTELSKVRAVAIAKLGIWVTIGEPSGGCSLISPKMFREFVKPYHPQLVGSVKKECDIPMTLHMCGYTDPIMEDLVSLGYDRIEIDSPSSLKKMVEVSQKRVVIRGNLAANLFSEGTKEEIDQAVKECIAIGAPGSAYILSQGCSIPAGAPPENVKYVIEAAQKYGRYENQ